MVLPLRDFHETDLPSPTVRQTGTRITLPYKGKCADDPDGSVDPAAKAGSVENGVIVVLATEPGNLPVQLPARMSDWIAA